MENPAHVLKLGSLQALKQLRGVQIIGVSKRYEVPPFFIRPEHVGEDQVFETSAIELPNEGASDETGGTGDEDFIS